MWHAIDTKENIAFSIDCRNSLINFSWSWPSSELGHFEIFFFIFNRFFRLHKIVVVKKYFSACTNTANKRFICMRCMQRESLQMPFTLLSTPNLCRIYLSNINNIIYKCIYLEINYMKPLSKDWFIDCEWLAYF